MKYIAVVMKGAINMFFALVLFSSLAARAQKNNDAIAHRLKAFYTYYIRDNAGPIHTFSKDTMRKYCSAAFLNKLKHADYIGSDPVVHFQDFDTAWISTLRVNRLSAGNTKKYQACFLYDGSDHCITLYLVKEQGQWKINKTCNGGECY